MRRTLGLVLILGAAFTALPRGQQPPVFVPPSPSADPTFRSTVEYVQVDVVATDQNGRPVANLTADDFEVFENGKPQAIKTFMPVDIPIQRDTPLPAGVEADVQTNARPDGHLYLFVLAGTEPDMALRTRYLARKFIDEYFGDNDIAAVVTGRSFKGDRQDFTSNRRLLLSAIDRFEGTGLDLVELADLMEMTASIPINRKVVMWFGEPGIDPYKFIDYNGGVFATKNEEAAHAALAAATRGNIRFYLFEPSGLVLADQSASRVLPRNGAVEVQARNDYRALAAMTGGVATINTNLFEPAFERMVSETSRYYLLGFESTSKKTPGRYVRLQVKSKRPDLTIRARTGYLEYMKYNQQRSYVPPTRTPVETAMASPLSTPGLAMRVVATPYRKSAREATVALSIDLDTSGLSFTEKNGRHVADVEIRHLATDADHRIYPLHRFNTTLSLDDAELEQAKTNGLRIASQFDVPPGRYQVRVASASGTKNGSVIYDLEAPDFAVAPITMSGVSLTASSALDTMTLRPGELKGNQGKVKQCRASSCEPSIVKASTMTPWRAQGTAAPAPILADVLPSAPSTVRTFNASDTLALFAEIYDNNPALKTSTAYDLTLNADLRSEAGTAVRSASAARPAQEPLRASGGHGFTLRLPLSNVPAGPYILHIEGRSTHDATPIVTRDIPIRVD
jgi:VWFA-related protein